MLKVLWLVCKRNGLPKDLRLFISKYAARHARAFQMAETQAFHNFMKCGIHESVSVCHASWPLKEGSCLRLIKTARQKIWYWGIRGDDNGFIIIMDARQCPTCGEWRLKDAACNYVQCFNNEQGQVVQCSVPWCFLCGLVKGWSEGQCNDPTHNSH
jgi:hypothetical protein